MRRGGGREHVPDAASPVGERLQINTRNCVHCKTCDTKDPTQHIVWSRQRVAAGRTIQACGFSAGLPCGRLRQCPNQGTGYEHSGGQIA